MPRCSWLCCWPWEFPLSRAPVIKNGRTLLTLEDILNVLELNHSWSPSARTVTLIKGEFTVTMAVGGNIGYVNDRPFTMDFAPLAEEGRVWLPVRFAAQAFGYEVDWDPVARAVILRPPVGPPVNGTRPRTWRRSVRARPG